MPTRAIMNLRGIAGSNVGENPAGGRAVRAAARARGLSVGAVQAARTCQNNAAYQPTMAEKDWERQGLQRLPADGHLFFNRFGLNKKGGKKKKPPPNFAETAKPTAGHR